MDFSLTPENLTVILGVVLSLAFSYIPGSESKWAQLDPTYKRLIMAGALLIITGAVFGLTCAGVIFSNFACDRAGLITIIWVYIQAIIANQSIYAISPRRG